mmetsp:Transcript_9217/g.32028  ORF Transcript_9217/g.32028 Transcript_9217/m.32028 type:complete len:204 (-) Transcript_9217:960-1571(-)
MTQKTTRGTSLGTSPMYLERKYADVVYAWLVRSLRKTSFSKANICTAGRAEVYATFSTTKKRHPTRFWTPSWSSPACLNRAATRRAYSTSMAIENPTPAKSRAWHLRTRPSSSANCKSHPAPVPRCSSAPPPPPPSLLPPSAPPAASSARAARPRAAHAPARSDIRSLDASSRDASRASGEVTSMKKSAGLLRVGHLKLMDAK